MFQTPTTLEGWKVIQNGFEKRWNFPNCCGAIDGKHVDIMAPQHCGSLYFNFKKKNSIVLFALVDHDYNFTYINVGSNGSASDGGIFRSSALYNALEENVLPDNGFIIGDDAFPLKSYLLKPYSRLPRNLTYAEKIFNYRLSRTRRIVESTFGILRSKFRIYENLIACSVEVAERLIRTTCALHNWLRNVEATYMPPGTYDEGDTTEARGNLHYSVISQTGEDVRNTYKEYFVTQGRVAWQDIMIT